MSSRVELYKKYLENLNLVMRIPGDLKKTVLEIIKENLIAEETLKKELSTTKSRFAKLRTSSENEYDKVQSILKEQSILIAPRQRPYRDGTNLTASQAFSNQKSLANEIEVVIAEIESIEKQKELEAREMMTSLGRRKMLIEENKRREEEERLRRLSEIKEPIIEKEVAEKRDYTKYVILVAIIAVFSILLIYFL